MDINKYKNMYDQISPSASLIQETKEKMKTDSKTDQIQNFGGKDMKKIGKNLGLGATAAAVLLVVSLNTSPALAAGLQDVPVIGKIAEVLTIRNFTQEDQDKKITVKQPGINGRVDVNTEIQNTVDSYVKDANERIQEYKKAFLETGGTEQEFAEKGIKVTVDYDIKCQSDHYLSFVLNADENWSNAYGMMMYYNLDMGTGEKVTLKDLLGPQYIENVNNSILHQMEARNAKSDAPIYFTAEEDGFTSITEETKFYINERGNPVIVFEKYEVAPGAFGTQEFEIVK